MTAFVGNACLPQHSFRWEETVQTELMGKSDEKREFYWSAADLACESCRRKPLAFQKQ